MLEVRDLRKYFPVHSKLLKRRTGWIKAVDGISFEVQKGEIFGVVGESGCGKTTLGKTILGILHSNGGTVVFKGRNLTNLSLKSSQPIRKELQYVYQDAGASLDPCWVVGRILREPLVIHTKLSKQKIDERVREIVKAVGLKEDHLSRYPHEFSGGQQRRLGLARILTLNPDCIIFDEPTSGLDVSVQATILKLLLQLKQDLNLTYIVISHNLAVMRMMSDRLAVMYLGKIVEMGETEAIFESPGHPYTQFLLAAIPEPGKRKEGAILKGEPPSPRDRPPGCCFWPRCPSAKRICRVEEPQLKSISESCTVACYLADLDLQIREE